MKITIFGADGQLGCDLQTALSSHDVVPLAHADVDISDEGAVATVLASVAPQWTINAAAMTHVDRCESEEQRAFAVNADGARHVAAACSAGGARLVHVSTDYVFDGAKGKPYVEGDDTNPLNVYGRSKLAGEQAVRTALAEHYIVRSSGLYGTHPCRGKGGANFVETMLRLASEKSSLQVVEDEVLTPTFTEDLAAVVAAVIHKEPPFGIYHATNGGECSWFEFASEIFRAAGIEVELAGTTAAAWNAPARRPPYSVLDNAALRRAGLADMPHWKDALQRYLVRRRP